MAHQKKKFKDLALNDAFLFSAALEDIETCELVLELILGTRVKLKSVKAENSILYSSEVRSIRLDIYADDEMQVGYDLEMQNKNEGDLAKRSRYHQAEMDLYSLKPGDDFNDLKPGYVIFLCTFDPFGDGLYRYTFEERCQENDRVLGDETMKIFLNTKGQNPQDVPESLVHFLKYVEQTTDEMIASTKSQSLQRLHRKIEDLKRSRKWEERYMTLGEWMDQQVKDAVEEELMEARAKVREETREEVRGEVREEIRGEVREEVRGEVREEVRAEAERSCQERLLALIRSMAADNRVEEIPRLESDEHFLNEMRMKYNL